MANFSLPLMAADRRVCRLMSAEIALPILSESLIPFRDLLGHERGVLAKGLEDVTADKRRGALVDDEHVQDVRRVELDGETVVA